MKLWKKIYDGENGPRLIPVTSLHQVDTTKPILVCFPGANGKSNSILGRYTADNTAEVAEKLLGIDYIPENTASKIEMLVVTYDAPFLLARAIASNRMMNRYHDKEVDKFINELLYPLLEDDRAKITFFGCSYGPIFAENVRNSLIKKYEGEGRERGYIRQQIGNILMVTANDISRATDRKGPRKNRDIDYSGVYFSYANDRVGRVANPAFGSSIPKWHKKGDISISKLTGNRVQFFMDAPARLTGWKTSEEGIQRKVISGRNKKHLGIRLNHYQALMLEDGVPLGVIRILERALRNGVTRKEKKCDVEYLIHHRDEPLSPSPVEKMHGATPGSLTDWQIVSALGKAPRDWKSHIKDSAINRDEKLGPAL